ncbi:DUF6087 family protein [Streptomyces sp. NPDC048664]
MDAEGPLEQWDARHEKRLRPVGEKKAVTLNSALSRASHITAPAVG